ncbi:phosphate propanoyltransferase [Sporolituus thermophilus]|uniref:Phosphate propanoyltransferase n=1 Tax=Sporolituus thermophilus DSM 23256 TaxID=1123285 RepID=A0A1G7M4A1_9FIRM|nr:putative phosphotransacetylase [Sporolituus thermophilus DSM 23256]
MEQSVIEKIVAEVLARLQDKPLDHRGIPVGISNRHIHLSVRDIQVLFGPGYELTKLKELNQPGEFAANETVILVGPKGVIKDVRVLGPVRKFTQVEISRTDAFLLGINPPVRDSGQIAGSAGITVVGPHGALVLTEGVICAARHLHMSPNDALRFGVKDGDRIWVEIEGERGTIFKNVLVRVHPNFRLELHLDIDEANAAGVKNGDIVRIWQERVNMAGMSPPQVLSAMDIQPAASPAKRRVVNAEAIKEAALSGAKVFTVAKGEIVTPLARDIARECGVEIVVADS